MKENSEQPAPPTPPDFLTITRVGNGFIVNSKTPRDYEMGIHNPKTTNVFRSPAELADALPKLLEGNY